MPQNFDLPTPNKSNYHVSSAATVWIAKRISETEFEEFIPVGNVITSSFEPLINRLEHKSNVLGLDTRDRNPVIEVGGSIKVEIDEIVRENLEYILLSAGRVRDQSFNINRFKVGTVASSQLVLFGGAAIQDVQVVLAADDDELPYEEGPSADYEVDAANGKITIPAGSSIQNGNKLVVYFTTPQEGTKYPIFTEPNIRAKVRIVSSGSNLGPRKFIEIPDTDLALDGSMPLLTKTEWQTATLDFSINEDAEERFGNWYHF